MCRGQKRNNKVTSFKQQQQGEEETTRTKKEIVTSEESTFHCIDASLTGITVQVHTVLVTCTISKLFRLLRPCPVHIKALISHWIQSFSLYKQAKLVTGSRRRKLGFLSHVSSFSLWQFPWCGEGRRERENISVVTISGYYLFRGHCQFGQF